MHSPCAIKAGQIYIPWLECVSKFGSSLRMHAESQENDGAGQTGSPCLDKPGLVCAVRYEKVGCKPAHTTPQRELSQQGTMTQCAGNLQLVLDILTAHQWHQEPYSWRFFPTLRLILNNFACLPFGAGFGAGYIVDDKAQLHVLSVRCQPVCA